MINNNFKQSPIQVRYSYKKIVSVRSSSHLQIAKNVAYGVQITSTLYSLYTEMHKSPEEQDRFKIAALSAALVTHSLDVAAHLMSTGKFQLSKVTGFASQLYRLAMYAVDTVQVGAKVMRNVSGTPLTVILGLISQATKLFGGTAWMGQKLAHASDRWLPTSVSSLISPYVEHLSPLVLDFALPGVTSEQDGIHVTSLFGTSQFQSVPVGLAKRLFPEHSFSPDVLGEVMMKALPDGNLSPTMTMGDLLSSLPDVRFNLLPVSMAQTSDMPMNFIEGYAQPTYFNAVTPNLQPGEYSVQREFTIRSQNQEVTVVQYNGLCYVYAPGSIAGSSMQTHLQYIFEGVDTSTLSPDVQGKPVGPCFGWNGDSVAVPIIRADGAAGYRVFGLRASAGQATPAPYFAAKGAESWGGAEVPSDVSPSSPQGVFFKWNPVTNYPTLTALHLTDGPIKLYSGNQVLTFPVSSVPLVDVKEINGALVAIDSDGKVFSSSGHSYAPFPSECKPSAAINNVGPADNPRVVFAGVCDEVDTFGDGTTKPFFRQTVMSNAGTPSESLVQFNLSHIEVKAGSKVGIVGAGIDPIDGESQYFAVYPSPASSIAVGVRALETDGITSDRSDYKGQLANANYIVGDLVNCFKKANGDYVVIHTGQRVTDGSDVLRVLTAEIDFPPMSISTSTIASTTRIVPSSVTATPSPAPTITNPGPIRTTDAPIITERPGTESSSDGALTPLEVGAIVVGGAVFVAGSAGIYVCVKSGRKDTHVVHDLDTNSIPDVVLVDGQHNEESVMS